MPSIDRIPGQSTRTRRALGGIGSDFIPYSGAIKDIDLGAFNLATTGLGIFGNLDVDTLNFNGNVISDSTNTVAINGIIDIEITTSSVGQITQNGDRLLHTFIPAGASNPNLFLGKDSGNFSMSSTLAANVGIGSDVLQSLTTGYYNCALGCSALSLVSSGDSNIGVGFQAGLSITLGDDNTFIGRATGQSITTGNSNTFVGRNSGRLITTVDDNTAFGSFALSSSGNVARCVALGCHAGQDETLSDRFIVDNQDRGSAAATRTNALLYGIMAAAQADQKLNVNGACDIGDGTNETQFAADGEIILAGTARVKNALWIDAGGIKAPGSKPATAIAHGTLETPAWQFADQAVAANQETVSWSMRVPNKMDRTVAPTIRIGVSTTTIFTDDAVDNETMEFQLEYLWRQINEDTTVAAQEILTVQYTLTAATPAEGLVILTFTGIDLPHADDACLHCRLTRLSAGNDTIADTIELHGVCFDWTSNKLGLAT